MKSLSYSLWLGTESIAITPDGSEIWIINRKAIQLLL
jgi:hypothetical protein